MSVQITSDTEEGILRPDVSKQLTAFRPLRPEIISILLRGLDGTSTRFAKNRPTVFEPARCCV
jgi:hypothetical protein